MLKQQEAYGTPLRAPPGPLVGSSWEGHSCGSVPLPPSRSSNKDFGAHTVPVESGAKGYALDICLPSRKPSRPRPPAPLLRPVCPRPLLTAPPPTSPPGGGGRKQTAGGHSVESVVYRSLPVSSVRCLQVSASLVSPSVCACVYLY